MRAMCGAVATGALLIGILAFCAAEEASGDDGRTLAKDGVNGEHGMEGVRACAACHGANGEGDAASGTPRLAAISGAYIGAQLQAFADGSRRHEVMSPIARGLSLAQMRDVAAYYATLPAPAAARQDAGAALVAKGAVLAWRGDWPNGIPSCKACHGAAGQGVGTAFPPLTGQPVKYLTDAMRAWKAGTRHNDPQAIMSTIAKRMSDDQIAATSAYYATTPLPPPPSDPRLPDGGFGEIVRKGAAIFNDTPTQAGGFLGNRLTCQNCHLDAGRLANAAPMGLAFLKYPTFRKKEGRVLTFAERLQGCFRYSMNGKPPPLGDEVLVALESYAFFLAKGQPVGVAVPGQGYPTPPTPALGLDFSRGAKVFEAKCKLCHGADGQGQTAHGVVVFPPLWGPGSFNWGAGMGRIDRAAGFIKANMPLSQGGSLTDQEAWDVAYFIDGHERPQDPRFTGDVAETRARFHDTPMSLYGTTVAGVPLGRDSPPSGPRHGQDRHAKDM